MAFPPGQSVEPLNEAASPRARDDQLRQWLMDYAPALRRYFMRKVSASEADDLVQDVFLALQVRGAAGEIANPEGYLFRVAANVLARRTRRTSWDWDNYDQVEEAHEDTDDLTDDLSPERVVMARQEVEAAARALRALPPRTAKAFVMHRVDGLSHEVIARHLGISTKGVEYLINKAIVRLTRRLRRRP